MRVMGSGWGVGVSGVEKELGEKGINFICDSIVNGWGSGSAVA